jgi:organic radical activating enzyme
MAEIASMYKVAYHRDRLQSYLGDESIFPACLELDITAACNRDCPFCPSTTSLASYTLSMDFVERLFARLEGQTRGLLLTGGEPTMAPTFPAVLRQARERGFLDLAVVTNGTLLGDDAVAAALLAHASVVRVSLYDWSTESHEGLGATLQRIEGLRSRIERDGSELQIGVSALTSQENASALAAISHEVASAGAHWIYFHPMCIRWDVGRPERVNQEGVLAQIEELQGKQGDGFGVFTFSDRYVESPLQFGAYHAAHFLLVIGADGKNYLGPEVKYHPQHAIADLAGNGCDGFLWDSERLRLIQAANHRVYPAIRSRHRGVLYNHFIEQLLEQKPEACDERLEVAEETFAFPHIL